MKNPKTRCSGEWTEARFRSFIQSMLRAGTMRWKPKYDSIKRRFVKHGINLVTGRPCKLHSCEICGKLVPQGELRVDHIRPVVDPIAGFINWDVYISRLYCEIDNFRAICQPCHDTITKAQNKERK